MKHMMQSNLVGRKAWLKKEDGSPDTDNPCVIVGVAYTTHGFRCLLEVLTSDCCEIVDEFTRSILLVAELRGDG